jgi:hypothetical protein
VKSKTVVELAQTASGIGAFLLGAGVGLLFYSFLLPGKYLFLFSGIILHSWGMIKLTKLKDANGDFFFYTNHWIKLGLCICVLAIITLIVYLLKLI